jgi:hypothetical protein
MTPSRFTVDPHILDNSDLSKVEVLRHWQHQVSVLLEQIENGIIQFPPGAGSTVYLDGTGNWSTPPGTSSGIPPNSLTDLGSPAGNSTINTAQAFVVAVNLKWTTAANWTLTLQNVALGSIFYLRLLNNSGATRTFTITATNPSAVSYTVTVLVPGSAPLSGAISINNGNALNVQGVSYTVGGNPTIQFFGFGNTG